MRRLHIMHKHYWANILMAIIGAILVVSIFGQMQFHIEALTFELSLQIFDHGLTELVIPPVGTISAKTHDTPLKFVITLQNIDMELLRRLFSESLQQQQLEQQLREEMLRVVRLFVLRIMLLSALGGMFGLFIIRRKQPITYVRGAIVGLVLMGVLLLGSYNTYSTDAFLSPRYEGILKAAPWMVGLAEDALGKLDKLGDQMQVMANNLYNLFEKVDTLEAVDSTGANVRFLHVSDLHNNPAAYDLVRETVRNFDVDAILDTGDISDFGTPLEARLVSQLAELDTRYIFVSGNHDSPEIVSALRKVPNVTVLDNNAISVLGVRITGIGDPAAVSNSIVPPNAELAQDFINRLEITLKNQGGTDILMVHNPGIAEHFAGLVPVILHGHDHQLKVRTINHSRVIDAGTSGAAGLQGLQSTKEIPYSVILLHFTGGRHTRLVAADSIKVFNLRSGFQLERTAFPQQQKQEFFPDE